MEVVTIGTIIKIREGLEKATYLNKKLGKQVPYSKATINAYINKFKQLHQPYKHLKQDPERTIKKLVERWGITARSFLSALSTISKNVKEFKLPDTTLELILKEIEKLNAEAREIAYQKTQNEPPKITMEYIKSYADKMKDKTSQDYLLLKLYIHWTARDDFGNLKIVKREPKYNTTFNFINISKRQNKIVLNDYKTEKLYGKKEVKLNNELRELILASLRKQPRQYLFTQPDGKRYARNDLSNHIIKVFKFSINDIRRAKIYALMNRTPPPTLDERERLAKSMMSSIDQQEFTYKRQ